MANQFFHIFYFILSLAFFISVPASAKIVVKSHQVHFIKEQIVQESKEKAHTLRFKHFNRFKKILARKHCAKAPFALDGKETYASLIPFSEYLEKADFKIAPDKTYAVVFCVRCERACAAAENPWKCHMQATVLDKNGYVLGDMEGNFLDIDLHTPQPEIILLRASAGSQTRYAEVYDLHGTLKRKIDDYLQP
jgi:hypothetical protein